MIAKTIRALPQFLETLGLDEEPMGVFYTDEKPADGFSPKESCIVIHLTPSDEFSNMSIPGRHPTSFVWLNPSANSQMLKCRN